MGIPDRAPQIRGVVIFACILGAISMILRIYARHYLARTWKIEDWLMLGATVTFLMNITTCLIGLHYGTGRHMSDLTPHNIEMAMMNWWLCYPSYALTMILSKFSIGIFLNRITPNRMHHWIMYVAMFLTALTGVAFFFIAILQCNPVNYWWKQIYPDVKGHCITIHAIMNITYAYSAVSILTDFTFAFLPIHIVMGLQMDRKSKLMLVPIFALATLASIACAIRLAYLPKFAKGDFLWNTSDIVIWSELEQGLAVTAGNLATLRPLFSLFLDKLNAWTGGSISRTFGGSKTGGTRLSHRIQLTPQSSSRDLFRKRSFSRDIEVQTNVDVHREKTTAADVNSPTSPKRGYQEAWLEGPFPSRGGSEEVYYVKSPAVASYNAV
ncbi:uncharacterized protein PV09_02894 [Verruconis gallopava]|uniref:Rhodopsin domain-containing protein n=1 Tax=Verruconis gallopava TaxID=253628 RepID=A0A0D2AIS8_9PEZI|nr:uncharacterized protein PV09_02894 [Verruconis gallopava]KIW06450.1 hypothetical protein PV09_02894 [Verruconis gallopava]